MTAAAFSTARLSPAHAAVPGYVRTTDGASLFYRDWGEGEPIVFVASWSMPSDSWFYSMLPLSQQGCRTVAFDRRGHGRSSDPGRGYDFDTLADDLAGLLEDLDLSRVTLVGHSMACGEIVRYLTRHGSGRVSRVVLVSTTTPMLMKTPDNPHGIEACVFEAVRKDQFMRDFPAWIEDNLRPFATPQTSPQVLEWVRGMALTTSLQAIVELHRSLTSADFRQELKCIDVPALVIHGDLDVSSPLDLTGCPTAVAIPRAELQVYEEAPHGLFVTHIDRLNADLLAFIKTPAGAGSRRNDAASR